MIRINPESPAQVERSMALSDVLRHVYETNPGLKASRRELQATQELYPQALAGWRPTLNAEGSIYATDIDSNNFSQGTGATTKEGTLSIQQPVFRGGRTMAETAKAKDLIMAARAQAVRQEQNMFLQGAIAYMNVVRDRVIFDLRRNNEKLLGEELHATEERLQAGDVTQTDARQAEARLARAHSETVDAEGQLEASNAEFEDVAGFAPLQSLTYPKTNLPIPPTPDAMFALMDQQNPDLVAARFEYTAAQHNADGILRELFPQIYAYASVNKQYDPQPGIIADSRTETIGLRASIALYQGGATRSRVRQAKNTALQRGHQVNDVESRVRAAIIADWKDLNTARAEIESRGEQIKAAELAREGVSEEARLGTRTVLDVLDASQELLEAHTELAVARRNAVVAEYSLAANLGLLTPEQFGVTQRAFDPDAHLDEISHKILSMSVD